MPSHWEVRKLGHILIKERRERPSDAELLVCTNKATVVKKGDSKMGLVSDTDEIYQGVCKGDLLIHGMDTWHGAIAVSTLDGMCTPVVHVCTSKESVKYVEYYLRNMAQNKVFKLISNGVRQNTSDFRSWNKIAPIPCLLPPYEEQLSIVSYLDDKCGKIDKMLERKQKQIELLAEMKQRIIADAVTRGLNPDVELKESGIFWIRHVPSHWNVRRLGHVLRKENRERPINAELLVCTNKAKVIKRGESKMGLIADSEDVYQGVKKGDLLIHGMDTWHGAIAISEYDGMCTPVVHVCTSNEDVGFISLYLRYMAMMKVFKLISNGVRQNTSDFRSWGKVAVIPCPLPPLDEQLAIVSYITDKTAKIDALTGKLQQEIESIKEYKQRLISDVVTGQIKVC